MHRLEQTLERAQSTARNTSLWGDSVHSERRPSTGPENAARAGKGFGVNPFGAAVNRSLKPEPVIKPYESCSSLVDETSVSIGLPQVPYPSHPE